MSDTAPRNPSVAPRMLADALLRTAGGTTALLRVTPISTNGAMSEVGLVATNFVQVPVSPAVMRRLEPKWQDDGGCKCELLVSATSVEEQVRALDLGSAQSLFAMTLAVTVNGQDYLIDSISANDGFGQTYVYRLLLREAEQPGV